MSANIAPETTCSKCDGKYTPDLYIDSKDRLSVNVPLVTQGVDPGYNTVVFGQIISSWMDLQS